MNYEAIIYEKERGRARIILNRPEKMNALSDQVWFDIDCALDEAEQDPEVKVVNTLCNEVRDRQAAAVELCGQVEVMFVLGGKQSANTRQLAQLCAQQGLPTYHLEGWDDFRPEMVADKQVAGVTAGASTPRWVVEEFVGRLREFSPGQ